MGDSLTGMLPWETNDEERDILVEECKEAILSLSANCETFIGPFQLPQMPLVSSNYSKKASHCDDNQQLEEDDTIEGGSDEIDEKEQKVEEDETGEEQDSNPSTKDKPSLESLEKLSKLQPLPQLLDDFDLHSHVGLIQRLLKEDPKLVEMQASLSGGGERERIFWKNYFFHCAFTRYEAGLSIDEIWNQEAQLKAMEKLQNHTQDGDDKNVELRNEKKDETTIVFSNNGQGNNENVS